MTQKGYFPLLNENIFKLTNILCHTKHSKKKIYIYIYFFKKKSFEKTWPKCSKYLIKLTLRSTQQNFGSFTNK
jgi:hypothetical protein